MPVLEQRGLFWWNDESVPERHFAPESAVPGLLRIEETGRAVVELDGFLTNRNESGASPGPLINNCIQGLLKEIDEYVLLAHLWLGGRRISSHAMSYERFAASYCIVGSGPFASGATAPTFDTITIPLVGFEEWLRLGSIKASKRDGGMSVTYEKPSDLHFTSDGETISISFDLDEQVSGAFGAHEIHLKESASATLLLRSAAAFPELSVQYGLFEDFIKLLTGSDYAIDWPRLSLDSSTVYRWYFQRTKDTEREAPKYYDTITSFPELRDRFGSLWSTWKNMRERYGPGVYSYLATRRGVSIYLEHRFVSLVWGLEALHREAVGDNQHGKKPARLSLRLLEVLKRAPIDLDPKRLRTFSDECAKLRNVIVHGEQRYEKPYAEFLKDLNRKSSALSTLYHALLLHEIGVDASVLKRWIYDNFGSFPIKFNFVEVGLLDRSVLEVKLNEPPLPTPPTPSSPETLSPPASRHPPRS